MEGAQKVTGASQTQLPPISRPAHTEFNLIYWQLMAIMGQELSVNTRTAEALKQEVWQLLQQLSLVIFFLFLLRFRKSIDLIITPLSLSANAFIRTSSAGFKSTIALYTIIYFLRCTFCKINITESHCSVLIELWVFSKSPWDVVFHTSHLTMLCQHNLLPMDPQYGQSIKTSLLTPTQLLETLLQREKLKGQANRDL